VQVGRLERVDRSFGAEIPDRPARAHLVELNRAGRESLGGLRRHWVITLRATLAPISVAGYVRSAKVLGNWLAAEELAAATAFRTMRRPRFLRRCSNRSATT
jgi:hypothetical protein